MLDMSDAVPLLASSHHLAWSPSSGRPNSSSCTSVSSFGMGRPSHSHDGSSLLPMPPSHMLGFNMLVIPTKDLSLPSTMPVAPSRTCLHTAHQGCRLRILRAGFSAFAGENSRNSRLWVAGAGARMRFLGAIPGGILGD
jgi:hypothetical protein